MPKTTTPIDTPSGETLEYPAKLVTVAQYETNNPGLKNRMRGYILRADLHSPDFEGLREAIVRIGRSVYLDEPRADSWVNTRRTAPAALPRNPHGRAGKRGAHPLKPSDRRKRNARRQPGEFAEAHSISGGRELTRHRERRQRAARQ